MLIKYIYIVLDSVHRRAKNRNQILLHIRPACLRMLKTKLENIKATKVRSTKSKKSMKKCDY